MPGTWPDIDPDPKCKERNVEAHEWKAASKPGDRIADSFRSRPLSEEVLLVLGDQVDLFLDVSLRHDARLSCGSTCDCGPICRTMLRAKYKGEAALHDRRMMPLAVVRGAS